MTDNRISDGAQGYGAATNDSNPTNTTNSSPWNFYVPFGDGAGASGRYGPNLADDVEHQEPNLDPKPARTNGDDVITPKTPFRQQWRAFVALSVPYFKESSEGRCLFLGLVILMLLNSSVRVAFSYLARDFWSALGDKDADQFYTIMTQFLIALLLLAPINVFYRFQRQRLTIKWRTWMTERILSLYFSSNRVYYTLERTSCDQNSYVDNPDQRLAEDVRSFTQYSLSLFLTIAISLIDLGAFSIILFSIEPNLFYSIIGFATLGTAITFLIGRQLVQLNFERLRKEADFRFSLIRVRENAESIAFFRGEATEGREISKRFSSVVANAYNLIGTQRNLDFFTASYNYLTWILPVVVIAPEYMAGNVELGVVQQAAAAFSHVLDDLSLIINEFEGLSEFSASIGRLHQLVRAVQDADPDRDATSPLLGCPPSDDHGRDGGNGPRTHDGVFKPGTNAVKGIVQSGDKTSPLSSGDGTEMIETINVSSIDSNNPYVLSIRNLQLKTPDCHRTLIQSLTLELKWGQRLLIIGPSGIGKSSLLRAIAGLWTSGSGIIERLDTSDVYFLPQRPYCPLGSLRDQLLYPSNIDSQEDAIEDYTTAPTATIPDVQLLEILKQVDLADLASRIGDGDDMAGLDVTMDFGNTLSLGEQQRLAFARVLVHQPKLVILDEATSAMDVAAEEKMYSLIAKRGSRSDSKGDISSGGTYVSVGHRPTLLGYHNVRLHLQKSNNGNGPCDYSVGGIQSTASAVAPDEVNLFFR
jgi:putative ATP-binding cassette transporter